MEPYHTNTPLIADTNKSSLVGRKMRYFVIVLLFALVVSAIYVLKAAFPRHVDARRVDCDELLGELAIPFTSPYENPYYLNISIKGELQGRATIVTHEGFVFKIGPGNVNTVASKEFYSRNATVTYSPIDVSGGELTFRAEFKH